MNTTALVANISSSGITRSCSSAMTNTISPAKSRSVKKFCANVMSFYIPIPTDLPIPFSALTMLVRRQEGHPAAKITGCWFVGGDILTAAPHVLQLRLLPAPPSPLALIKSRIMTFCYRLTQVHLENGR